MQENFITKNKDAIMLDISQDQHIEYDVTKNEENILKNVIPKGFYLQYINLFTDSIFRYLKEKNIDFKVINEDNSFVVLANYKKYEGGSIEDYEPYLQRGIISFQHEGNDCYISICPTINSNDTIKNFIATDTADGGLKFLLDVNNHFDSSSKHINIYDGNFISNKDLYESFRKYSWDDIVLPNELKEDIKNNIDFFFDNGEETYRKIGVDWKRGFIFTGPPGSGKSLMGKIISAYKPDIKFIYVTSFLPKDPDKKITDGIKTVYNHAAKIAPSIVFLEDLDTLIDNNSRTEFLNILDGFKMNNGILTIGTTNYPEKIDVALLKRPSRFDKKYVFELPISVHRKDFLMKMFKNIVENIDASLEFIIDEVVKETDGYSYAFLKEIYILASIDWINHKDTKTLEECLIKSHKITQSQIKLSDKYKLEEIIQHTQEKSHKVGFN